MVGHLCFRQRETLLTIVTSFAKQGRQVLFRVPTNGHRRVNRQEVSSCGDNVQKNVVEIDPYFKAFSLTQKLLHLPHTPFIPWLTIIRIKPVFIDQWFSTRVPLDSVKGAASFHIYILF